MIKLSYLKLLSCVKGYVDCKLTLKTIFFPDVHIIGCCVHLKQASGWKLKPYCIPKAEAKATAHGVFDTINVIHSAKIDIQGIASVKMKIRVVCKTK
ncbi:hypothetical protein PHMEG_00025380 [Phytophthora megakarya]|uniref:Uncharacterized protein n=1 Tax=Phytophthora megakarya TaxID=4795 RepID=A0A225VDL3_9STRA|nr:hypothetical protein PHMEG_00025380 [Phytophthora megakarya]